MYKIIDTVKEYFMFSFTKKNFYFKQVKKFKKYVDPFTFYREVFLSV